MHFNLSCVKTNFINLYSPGWYEVWISSLIWMHLLLIVTIFLTFFIYTNLMLWMYDIMAKLCRGFKRRKQVDLCRSWCDRHWWSALFLRIICNPHKYYSCMLSHLICSLSYLLHSGTLPCKIDFAGSHDMVIQHQFSLRNISVTMMRRSEYSPISIYNMRKPEIPKLHSNNFIFN